MSIGETTSNQPETIGEDITEHEAVMKRLDHIDDQLHEIRRFIDDNRVHLDRFTKNPVLSYLKGRKDG